MIYEVEGDILLSRAQMIVQEVTVNDPMQTHLARRLADRFPVMRSEYLAWCESEQPGPGQIWLWPNPMVRSAASSVANLITREPDKDDPGRRGRFSKIAFYHCLQKLNKQVGRHRIESIALPRLATEQGGLDWYESRGIIHSALGNLLIPVVIYATAKEGMLAYEPEL